MITKIHSRMEGVGRTLCLLTTVVVLSAVAVHDQQPRHDLQQPRHDLQQPRHDLQGGGWVWYPWPGLHLARQPSLFQYLVLPTVYHHSLQNGTYVRAGYVPTVSHGERCSHSSQDEGHPHISQDEEHPHSSQDEQHLHTSQDEQHPYISLDEEHPHISQDEQHPYISLDEEHLHISQDEQHPYISEDKGHPHFSQDEQHPHISRDEQHLHISQDEQHPYISLDEGHLHFSQDEGHPHISQDEQHPYISLDEGHLHFSQDEGHPHTSQDEQYLFQSSPPSGYDPKTAPPSLDGYDPLTTTPSVFNDSSERVVIRQYDLSKLSLEAKERLKSVVSLEELLQVPGFSSLLEEDEEGEWEEEEGEEPEALPEELSHRSSRMYRSRGRRRGLQRLAPSGGCDVEKVSKKLSGPRSRRLFPSCVRLARCGGCCPAGRTCTAVTTNTLYTEVLQMSEDLDTVLVVKQRLEEAAECSCQCQLQAADCDPGTQDYHPDNCTCVCKSSLAAEQARCEASPMHRWHPSRCSCVCLRVSSRECSSGRTFYEDTCRCETPRQE